MPTCAPCWNASTASRALGIAAADTSRRLAHAREPVSQRARRYPHTAERHAAWLAGRLRPRFHDRPCHPRSRLRARLVLAGFATVGSAGLGGVRAAPAANGSNPSDSVAVGWYRIEPFDPHRPARPLSVDSIVLMPLPGPCRWLRAFCRPGCSTWAQSRHNTFASSPARFASTACGGRRPCLPTGPLPSLQLCRRLQPGELFC